MRYGKGGLYLAAAAIGCMAAGAQAQEATTFKLGVVTFLSGPAAESFGVPVQNAAKLVIEAMNQGGVLPKPYDKPGFGGLKIEPI
jgi:branched-chain amino acid transport system substrate-binding protein